MATTTIPWNDGSGDNITLTYPSASGDQTVDVSSDANTGAARTKVITFSTGDITQQLTVNQRGVPQQYTLEVNPSSFIPRATDGAWYSLDYSGNAYNDESNTTYAQIRLTRGSTSAVTYCYYCFDTSDIPADATIDSVECKAKIFISNTTSTNVAVRQVQMFSGTTAMGSSQNATTTTRVVTYSGTSWTREQVGDVRIRFYAERGTKNLNSDYSFRFYGATLTIKYTY